MTSFNVVRAVANSQHKRYSTMTIIHKYIQNNYKYYQWNRVVIKKEIL